MGLAHFLPANAKRGKTKHYKKIHIDTNITHRDVCLYYLLYRIDSGSGVCLKNGKGMWKIKQDVGKSNVHMLTSGNISTVTLFLT